ncbi:MAG: hypothetical protein ACOVPA_06725 [Rubrivivax sp.]
MITAYPEECIFKLAPKQFRKQLIIPVLMNSPAVKIGSARQILPSSTAGMEAVKVLSVAASAPMAQVRRVFCDPSGTVIYLGELT